MSWSTTLHRSSFSQLHRPSYIAGVTNPIFEATGNWDLLCDVGGGRMVVSKDIHTNYPYTASALSGPPQLTRVGTIKTDSLTGEEEATRPGGAKSEFTAKTDSADNMFVEDVCLVSSLGRDSP